MSLFRAQVMRGRQVKLECEDTHGSACYLSYHVEAAWMPAPACYALGLPCGYWNALLWFYPALLLRTSVLRELSPH